MFDRNPKMTNFPRFLAVDEFSRVGRKRRVVKLKYCFTRGCGGGVQSRSLVFRVSRFDNNAGVDGCACGALA